MRKALSSQATAASILVLGLIIGASLVFVTTYIYGSSMNKTVVSVSVSTSTVSQTTTQTVQQTTTQTLTLTTTETLSIESMTSTSADLQLTQGSCTSGAAGTASCTLDISNTGGGATGTITGCNIYGVTGTVTGAPVSITAGTAFPGTAVTCVTSATGPGITSGAAVSGSLVVASGSPLAFSEIAS